MNDGSRGTGGYPDVAESQRTPEFLLLNLEALVKIKSTAFRDEHRTPLRDLLEVGLVDEDWLGKFEPDLPARLKKLFDDPDG